MRQIIKRLTGDNRPCHTDKITTVTGLPFLFMFNTYFGHTKTSKYVNIYFSNCMFYKKSGFLSNEFGSMRIVTFNYDNFSFYLIDILCKWTDIQLIIDNFVIRLVHPSIMSHELIN